MGSSCSSAVDSLEGEHIPEGIVELKKQTQFTENWKRKYDVTLNCYFTTVSRLCTKAMPALKGCNGVIVVKILITNNDPKHPKLSSILHAPILQWHGIDVKLQLPKCLPLNLWEGENTCFAFYHPETATNRGFCTVTGKIGQEQILLEEELRFGNPVPSEEWKTLSKDLEVLMQRYLKHTRKKIRTSADRTSQRDSHDTGYTSEQHPHPTLRYSEHDTDSDQEFETHRQKDQRSKARRKDTPHYGRPIIKGSPKGFQTPLIEELEMNQDSSEDHTDQFEHKEASEEANKADTDNTQDNVFKRSSKVSFINKRKTSTKSISAKPPEDRGVIPKRKSKSLVDMSHIPEIVKDVSASVDALSYHSAEKCIVRPRRKKKSLTSKLMKERSTEADLIHQYDVTSDVTKQVTPHEDAHDADDEDDSKKKTKTMTQLDVTDGDGTESYKKLTNDDRSQITTIRSAASDGDLEHSSNVDQSEEFSSRDPVDKDNTSTKQLKGEGDVINETKESIKDESKNENVIALKEMDLDIPNETIIQSKNEGAKYSSTIDTTSGLSAVEASAIISTVLKFKATTKGAKSNPKSHTLGDSDLQIPSESTEAVSDDAKIQLKTLGVTTFKDKQVIDSTRKGTSTDISTYNGNRATTVVKTDPVELAKRKSQDGAFSETFETIINKSESADTLASSNIQVSRGSPTRPKAGSFSAKERRTPSPRKHFSLCSSDTKAELLSKREAKTNVKPPKSTTRGFCEEK